MAHLSTWQQRPRKRVPTAKITSWQGLVNQELMHGLYKTDFNVKGHDTWSITRILGLCFHLVSIVLISFDCVMYMYLQ